MNEDFHYVAGLERRVTALEQDLAEARDKVEALHVLLQARDAETDALRKQQCMTCQHSRIGTGINSVAFYYCNKHCKPCDKFGHHCGMWARREP